LKRRRVSVVLLTSCRITSVNASEWENQFLFPNDDEFSWIGL